MEYNEENLKIVSDIIIKNLGPELLHKKWIEMNKTNQMFDH